jgi:hypothetical protein
VLGLFVCRRTCQSELDTRLFTYTFAGAGAREPPCLPLSQGDPLSCQARGVLCLLLWYQARGVLPVHLTRAWPCFTLTGEPAGISSGWVISIDGMLAAWMQGSCPTHSSHHAIMSRILMHTCLHCYQVWHERLPPFLSAFRWAASTRRRPGHSTSSQIETFMERVLLGEDEAQRRSRKAVDEGKCISISSERICLFVQVIGISVLFRLD